MLLARRSLTWTAVAMGGWLWVACGQGIYTHSPADAGGDDGDAEPLAAETMDAAPSPDLSPIDAGNPSVTATIDWRGGEIVAGDARLIIPKDVLGSADQITLTQVSADGVLPGYRGAVGPVFVISKNAVFQRPARFELTLTPDPSIPASRLALAYIDPKARLWLILSDSAYDSSTGVISAPVNEFSSSWTVGLVLRCNAPGECGTATECQGGVCQ